MINKVLGNSFEKEVERMFANRGYWVHLLAPNSRGAQPFDLIAISNSIVFGIDCKTLERQPFNLSRIEDNQWLAFEQFKKKTNALCGIMVKFNNEMYFVEYAILLRLKSIGGKSIKLEDNMKFD